MEVQHALSVCPSVHFAARGSPRPSLGGAAVKLDSDYSRAGALANFFRSSFFVNVPNLFIAA